MAEPSLPPGTGWRAVAERASDVLVVCDATATVTWASPSLPDLLGWRPGDIVGRPFALAGRHDDLDSPVARDPVSLALAGDTDVVGYRGWSRRSDGSHLPTVADVRLLRVPGVGGTTADRDARAGVSAVVVALRDASRDLAGDGAGQEAAERFRMAMQHSAIGMCLIGPDGSFLAVNPAVCDMLGRDAPTLTACTWQELTHPDDLEVDLGLVGDVLAGRIESYRLDKRYLRPDGTLVYGDLSVSCVRDADGAVRYFISQIVDMTEQVLARQAAEVAQRRRVAALEAMTDPYVLLEAVRHEGRIVDFVFVEANPAACEFNRRSRDELIGARLLDLHPAAEQSGLLDQYTGVVERGEVLALDDWEYAQDVLGGELRVYDVRAVKVGDAVSQVWRDVTQRHRTAERIATSEARFRLLAENASDVVLLTEDGVVTWASPSLSRMLGWHPDEWTGRPLADLVHPDDLVPDTDDVGPDTSGGSRRPEDEEVRRVRLPDRTGTYRWVEIHSGPDTSGLRGSVARVSSFRTIDEVMAYEEELHRRAATDDLTGLARRAVAIERLAADRRDRHPGVGCAVLFCDLDDFKAVNDEFGHAAGDEVLRAVAARIRDCVRASDMVARMGGDEFLVILDALHGVDEATAVAAKIRQACVHPIAVPGRAVAVTMSIGVTMRTDSETADRLIARADRAMYQAKQTGRDRIVVLPADPR